MTTCNAYLPNVNRRCTMEYNHVGPCAYEQNGRTYEVKSNMSNPPSMAVVPTETYRSRVSNCTYCRRTPGMESSVAIFNDPRFGTGNRVRPRIMVVGQNPPREPTRRLHGAWMLHYPADQYGHLFGPHERLVHRLVYEALGYRPTDVFATQAFKCATHFNAPPVRSQSHACARLHLQQEVSDLKPEIVLCLGRTAADTYVSTIEHLRLGDPHYRTWHVKNRTREMSGDTMIRTVANIIEAPAPESVYVPDLVEAPHPSFAQRFLDTEDWINQIVAARDYLVARLG